MSSPRSFTVASFCIAAFVAGAANARARADVPTWAREIAPLFHRECVDCHHPGEAAPFSLLDYDEAARHARQIAKVTASRRMPPWLPLPSDPPFLGARHLSDAEIDLLREWAEAGAPSGDLATAPAAPSFATGWRLGTPDLVVEMPADYTLRATGSDLYRNFVIPVAVNKSHDVRAVEIHPGNSRVVHHAVLKRDRTDSSRRADALDAEVGFDEMDVGAASSPDGQFLGWTPGRTPQPLPDGMSWRIAPGDDLVLQLHLLPSGKPEQVCSSVGLYFADTAPKLIPYFIHLGSHALDIPAGARDFEVRDQYVLPVAADLHALVPHAHFLGTSVTVWAVLPDGTKRTLLEIPRWDFSWQDEFRYATPIALPARTLLAFRFTFDNSDENPRNPHRPAQRVRFGASSLAEMCDVWVQVVPPNGAALLQLARDESAHVTQIDRAGFEALLADDETNWRAQVNLGVALLAQGDRERALRCLRRATGLAPGDADAHFRLAQALGDGAPARAELETTLRLEPDHAEATSALAAAAAARGDAAEAERLYRKAIALRPISYSARAGLAVLLERKGELDEAAQHLEVAVEVETTSAAPRRLLADLERRRGRAAAAVAQYKKLLWFGPDPEAQRWLAWLLATAPDDALRDGGEALEFARALVAHGSDDPAVLDTLAAAQAEVRRFKAAVETAQRAEVRANALGDTELAAAIERRIEVYRAGNPWRDVPAAR